MYWKTLRDSQKKEQLKSWFCQYCQVGSTSAVTILWQESLVKTTVDGWHGTANTFKEVQGGHAQVAQPNT